jgi:hypothetical protein
MVHRRMNAEGEMYAMQHYVIKFVSELRQGGVFFLRVLPLVPSIKSSFVSEKVKAIERLINQRGVQLLPRATYWVQYLE